MIDKDNTVEHKETDYKMKYAEVMCNWFNNSKGSITLEEIRELLWCMYGLEQDTYSENLISDFTVHKLNVCVVNDDSDRFYLILESTYSEIKSYIVTRENEQILDSILEQCGDLDSNILRIIVSNLETMIENKESE